MGDVLGYEGCQVLKHCHQLQAENALLKAQIAGLQEAVHIEKKQKKPKKALFAELHGNEGSGAIFFSQAKISAVCNLQAQKAKEVEGVQAQKQQDKLQMQQCKEEQVELKRSATAAWLGQREKLALEKAQKQAQRERAITQHQASLQLSNEQRTACKNQQKKHPKAQHHTSSGGTALQVIEKPVVVGQQMPTSRSGRQLCKPQHLDNYQLQLKSFALILAF